MSSFVLKIIACVCMFIDHLSYIIPSQPFIMHYIGRLAFPIFAFQISKGYIHTKNVKKYAFKLFIFALVSQIPFILYFKTSNLNVFFTLLLGLLGIFIYDKLAKKNNYMHLYIGLPIIALVAFVAEFFHFDYGYYGILIISIFYIFRDKKLYTALLFVLATITFFIYQYSFIQILASPVLLLLILFTVLGIVPCLLYNGKQGYRIKYFLYLFYPCHLLLLYLAAIIIY